jgi:peptidoglycan/LPS O-acetylase OafA/YrhL
MRTEELPALTGIRFYAALAVFVSHVSLVPKMERLSNGHKVFDLGFVGVSFFFVLSGFILTNNYADFFRRGIPAGITCNSSGVGFRKYTRSTLPPC